MKTYKWYFLILIASVFVACGGDSEEELVGDWQRKAFLPKGGRSYAASFVIGNKGYVCCGYNGSGDIRSKRKEMFVFDNSSPSGSWLQLNDFPGGGRQQAVGFSLNGYGYMGTGWDGDQTAMKDFWKYDPASDAWTQVAPLPVKALARRGAIAFSLKVNEKWYGYVGTGYTEYPEDEYLLDFWQYDPEGTTTTPEGEVLQGVWTEVAGYGGYKRVGASVFVIDNKAYICNGKNPNFANDFWVFDPDGAAKGGVMWTQLRNMYNSNPDEDYDDDYGYLQRSFGAAFVVPVSGELRGHIVGGDGSYGYTVWEYDLVNDLWTQRTSFYNNSQHQARVGGVAFSFPDPDTQTQRAFFGMGQVSTAYYDDLWEFIPLIEDYTYNDQ